MSEFLPRDRAVQAAGGTWKAVKSILREPRLTPGQARVLLALLDIDGPSLRYRPGRGQLAVYLGGSRSAVGRFLSSLIAGGWIILRPSLNGHRDFWEYRLPDPEGGPKVGTLFDAKRGSDSGHPKGGPIVGRGDAPGGRGGDAPGGTDVQVDVQVNKQQPPYPPKGEAVAIAPAGIPFASELAKQLTLDADPWFINAWIDWNTHLKQKRHTPTKLAAKRQLAKCAKMGLAEAIAMIEHSITGGYQGMYAPNGGGQSAEAQEESVGDRAMRLLKEKRDADRRS